MSVFPTFMYVYHVHVGTREGQKKVSDFLGL